MSAYTLHSYERVFPDPHSFVPDRWLEGDVDLMRKYWVPFGRGSRACIGISLAYVELYHVIAAVFRPNGRKSSRFFDVRLVCAAGDSPYLSYLGFLAISSSKDLRLCQG